MKIIKKILKGIGFLLLSLAVIFIGFAVYLGILHRQPLHLPAPTGSYSIGRTEYDWTDEARIDTLADIPNQKRELLIWVWYPAGTTQQGSGIPYLPSAWISAHDQDQGIGKFLERDFSSIQTHSFANVSLAKAPDAFPVIIMQPGMGPSIPDYTVFAENLASHGYIVVGINETYTSNIIVFPNGRIVPRSQKGTIPDSADATTTNQDANRIEKVWADDVLFVMDKLQRIGADPSSFLYRRLDLAHIGIFGHSFGGATAVRICEIDTRCSAGADLDGTIFSDDIQHTIPKPFLFMAEDACGKECATMHQMYLSASNDAYYLSIGGTKHFNFSDLPLRLLPPARSLFHGLGFIGSIQSERGLKISNAYLVAFFDHFLKGVDSGLLQGPSSTYPEVQFEKHSRKKPATT